MAISAARLAAAVVLVAVAPTMLLPAPAQAYISAKWARTKVRNEVGEGTLLQIKCYRLIKERHLLKPDTSWWVSILSEKLRYHGEVTVTYPGKPGQQDRVDCQYLVNKEGRRCKWTIFDDKNNAWDERGESMIWYAMRDGVYQENPRKISGVEIGPTKIRVRHCKLFALGDLVDDKSGASSSASAPNLSSE